MTRRLLETVRAFTVTGLIALIVFPSALSARSVPMRHIHGWLLVEHYNPGNDDFLRCSVEKNFEPGVRLAFAFNANNRIEMFLVHPDFNLAKESRFPVKLEMGEKNSVTVEAETVSEDMLLAFFDDNNKVYFGLLTSEHVTIRTPTGAYDFKLEGLRHAMPKASECVSIIIGDENYRNDADVDLDTSSNDEQPGLTDQSSLIDQVVRLAIDEKVHGLGDFKIYRELPEEAVLVGASIAWSIGNVFGLGSQFEDGEGVISNRVAEIIAKTSARCPDDLEIYEFDKKPLPTETLAQSILMQCIRQGREFTAVYSYLPLGRIFFEVAHVGRGISEAPEVADDRLVDGMISVMEIALASEE